MNDEMEVSDEQMVKCFGKYRSCVRKCRLKEVCLGKYREQEEEHRRKKYREASYIDGMDAGAEHVAPDFEAAGPESDPDDEEIASAIEQLDVSDRCRRAMLKIQRAKAEDEEARGDGLELLRRLGEMYVNDPTGFEVLFFQILAGGNQAALARRRGCSKQNINKIVAKGKKRLEAYRAVIAENPACRLTSREIAVYHFAVVENCSYRKTGKFLGISKDTVRKTVLGLAAKGFSGAILTSIPRVAKIFQKIRPGEPLKNAERVIFEDVCDKKRTLRAAAKNFHCSHELVRRIRVYASEKRLLTAGK